MSTLQRDTDPHLLVGEDESSQMPSEPRVNEDPEAFGAEQTPDPATAIEITPPPKSGNIEGFLEENQTNRAQGDGTGTIVASTATLDKFLATSVSATNNPFINNSYSRGDHRLPEANPQSPYAPVSATLEEKMEANEDLGGETKDVSFKNEEAAVVALSKAPPASSSTLPLKAQPEIVPSPAPVAPPPDLAHMPTIIKPLAAPYCPSRNTFRHDEFPDLEEESVEDTYYILVQTLFLVGCLVAAKICMRRYIPWKGEIELGEIGLVYTGLFYLLGVVFGGVNNDLKEAEKMPMDVVCSLDQLEDTFIICGTKVADKVNLMDAQMLILRFARTWRDMLAKVDDGRVTYGDVLNALADIVDLARTWDKQGATACVNITTVVDKIRRIVGRGTVVQRTDVLPSARALLHFFIIMSSILLFIASYKTELACGIVMACVITVTIFMARMINAMDDPFQTKPPAWKRWMFGHMAAVQTFPLVEYILRMERRMEKEYAVATLIAENGK